MRILNTDKPQLPQRSVFGLQQGTPIMKKQMLCGLVTGIVDGNTFEISVQNQDGSKNNSVKRIEKIRIHGMDKPAASTLSGILAKLELEKMIVGHTLECEVIDKDDRDQLIAVVPKKYFRSPFSFSPHTDP